MEREFDGNVLYETYQSLNEFVEHAAATVGGVSFSGGASWSGASSWGEALKFAREGWPEQLPGAMDIAEGAVTYAEKEHILPVFTPLWDVSGSEPDVARFLSGEPENMIEFPLPPTSKTGKVISLVVSRGARGSVDEEAIVAHGRLVVALSLVLEQMGLSTEIWLDWPKCINHRGGGQWPMTLNTRDVFSYQRVLIKGTDDIIDPAVLMYGMGHPSLHRMIHFKTLELMPGRWRTTSYGASMPRWKKCEELYPEGTIFMPTIEPKSDAPKAEKFLKDHLKALGLIAE